MAGFDVVDDPAAVRSAIGVALQEAALDPLMTGSELIRLQATLHGIGRAEGKRRSDDLLRRVGLTRAADRRVGTYSGGMKRRLDLASALVHEPRVLFLDEPTTGLDPVSRKAIWEEVSALNREGTTVFLTTQYLEEADQLADRVGIISDGRIVAEGTPGSLKAEVGKPRMELVLAAGERTDCMEVLSRFGDPLPPRDGKLMIEVESGAGGDRARRPRARPGGDPGRVARRRRADAGRRLRREDRPAPRGRGGRRRARGRRRGGRDRMRTAAVVIALGRRSVRQTFRRPQLVAPLLIIPTLLLAVQSAGAGRAVDIPGFPPVESFFAFLLAGAMIQSALLAGNSGGIALAIDIEMGFTDRLLAAPIPRFAIVAGRLAGTAAIGAVTAVWFLAIGVHLRGERSRRACSGRC